MGQTRIISVTHNLACILQAGSTNINAKILRLDSIRAQEMANRYLRWNLLQGKPLPAGINDSEHPPLENDRITVRLAPRILCTQELFSKQAMRIFKKTLGETYPHSLINVGQHPLSIGSGLSIMSQYEILDYRFFEFPNNAYGEESFASKGCLAVKLKIDDHHFLTVYNTHLLASGSWIKPVVEWIFKKLHLGNAPTWMFGDSNSKRRGIQMQLIADHLNAWAKEPIAAHPHLVHIDTIFMGDTNTGLQERRTQLSVSTGFSEHENGFKTGQIKHPGQYHLFSSRAPLVPKNYKNVRTLAVHGSQIKKTFDLALRAEAGAKGLYTGSSIEPDSFLALHRDGYHDVPSNQGRGKILEAMHPDKVAAYRTSAESEILNSGNSTDHFPIMGTMEYQLPSHQLIVAAPLWERFKKSAAELVRAIINTDNYSRSNLAAFFGVPTLPDRASWFSYFFSLNFIFSPLKNTVKLAGEFLPRALADALQAGIHYINRQPNFLFLNKVAKIILYALWLPIKIGIWFGRRITAPIASCKEAFTFGNRISGRGFGTLLAMLSLFQSMMGIIAIGCLLAPFTPLFAATKLPAIINWLSHSAPFKAFGQAVFFMTGFPSIHSAMAAATVCAITWGSWLVRKVWNGVSMITGLFVRNRFKENIVPKEDLAEFNVSKNEWYDHMRAVSSTAVVMRHAKTISPLWSVEEVPIAEEEKAEPVSDEESRNSVAPSTTDENESVASCSAQTRLG